MSQKVVLVTGASSGMGKDFAKTLAQKGMVVYAAARRLEKMDDLKGYGVIPVKMDITDEAQITSCVETIVQNHGGVDILVNNAGYAVYGAMEDISLDDARRQFDVNVFGLARLTQLIIPHMRAKRSGKIINITSIGGKIYSPLGSWYHATKHALEGWSDCLRLELKPFGIDVVIVEPGAIQTEFGDVMIGPMLKRSGHGEYADIAHKSAERVIKEYNEGGGSSPSVITNLIVKAITAKKPKTRYAAGKYAAQTLFIRKWFSDRVFDRMIMSMFS